MSIWFVMKCVIITFSLLLTVGMLTLHGGSIIANQQSSFKSEDLEEIRENVMEVRLALQKGDLIEALQHLNNVDEDLLLLATSPQPSNSMSVYNNSSNIDSTSNSQTQEPAHEEGIMGANYDGGNNNDNSSENNSDSYESAELGQKDTLSNSNTFPISNNTVHLENSTSSVGAEGSGDHIRKLKVTFNSIFINDNHDILFPAEWQLDAYVNNKRIHLSDHAELARAESGHIVDFKGKSLAINVPENSTLRIVTVGAEMDEGVIDGMYNNNWSSADKGGDKTGDGVLPDISGILDTKAPLPEYRDKVEDSIQFLTTYDRNDAIGMITSEFDARNNFGIGNHYDCSESTGEVGDIFDTVDTNCDYRLSYTIEGF